MIMFASKTPRDLNHDPEWMCGRCGGIAYEHSLSTSTCIWEPIDPKRPEFDHVQHNEPNPILVDVRRYVQERSRMNQPKGWPRVLRVFSAAADYGHFITGDWERITSPEQIAHARKVLTRLAALEG